MKNSITLRSGFSSTLEGGREEPGALAHGGRGTLAGDHQVAPRLSRQKLTPLPIGWRLTEAEEQTG